ncbi:MAG: TRM11 family SAM-dependent methyltransferase, partial [Terriglobia bacterium]
MITRIATPESKSLAEILQKDLQRELFPAHLELVPQLNELYELQLAFYESRILTDAEVVKQGAYFAQVNGQPTRHYLICKGESLRLAQYSSSRLKAFFKTNQFKTGYATHGLFPYRGKFHPQMVKGILNVMGLKPGETVLDPMMGSGTTLIEATLMGIDSIGIDTSPFCKFMTQAKLDGLRVPLAPVEWALHNAEVVFEHFARTAGHPNHKAKPSQVKLHLERGGKRNASLPKDLAEVLAIDSVRNYLLLAFLDSAGYSVRSQRRSPFDQFRAILERYLFVAKKIQGVMEGMESEFGKGTALEGDARSLSIKDNCVE